MSDDQDGFKASFKDGEGVNAALHLCIADRDEEIVALRARVAKLEAALTKLEEEVAEQSKEVTNAQWALLRAGEQEDALRARVAKLEAALEEIARLSPSARARRTAERALKDSSQ